MSFWSTVNRRIELGRGRTLNLQVNQKLTPSQVRRLDSLNRSSYYTDVNPAPRSGRRFLYTESELLELVYLYLENDNTVSVRDRYLTNNPDTNHTPDSVQSVAYQLRSLDVNYPDYTNWVPKCLVIDTARSVNPDRFGQNVVKKQSAKDLLSDLSIDDIMSLDQSDIDHMLSFA